MVGSLVDMAACVVLTHTHPGVRESKNANPEMRCLVLECGRVVSSRLLPLARAGMEGRVMGAQDRHVPGALASGKHGQDGSVLGSQSTVGSES